MKQKNIIQQLLFLVLPVFTLALLSHTYKDIDSKDPIYGSNDLVYIKGNDTIQSFYISRHEVCNWEYLIYLTWLVNTYGVDYPEVYSDAIPDTTITGGMLWDPAYKYYPVLGVSWRQANNYCMWKTDRYNEYILIREGILKEYFDQVNESNFNTESYLAGQYEGLVRCDILDEDKKTVRKVMYKDRILQPAFRLPTESEWEYAAYLNEKNMINQPTKKLKKNSIGNNFLTIWHDHYIKYLKCQIHYDLPFCKKMDKIKSPLIYYVSKKMNPIKQSDFSTIYDDSENMILKHMNDNVSEWIFDIYIDEKPKDYSDLLSIYSHNNQTPVEKNNIYFNAQGEEYEKDSLGKMRYIYLCNDRNGNPVKVKSYNYYYENEYINPNKKPVQRIYRGGSWKNKGLNVRDFLNEDSSTSTLGFRCVMSAVNNE